MTVAELIEQLQQLPPSAQTATVVIVYADFDEDPCTESIEEVVYEYGEVMLTPPSMVTA